MRRVLSIILGLLLIFALCGCAGDNVSTQDTVQPNGNTNEETQDAPQNGQKDQADGDIKFLSCRFADEIHAADGEAVSIHYEKIDGKVYVDLLFSVDNKTTEKFDGSTISGWLSFKDTKTTLQFCRNGANATSVSNDPVLPDEHAYVHLFTCLSADAENEDLTVHYTVSGNEYECVVNSKDTSHPLSAKTQIKAGDMIDVPYTRYAFKVLSVGKVENLQASNQKDNYFVGPFALVKLEVINNHTTRTIGVNDILAYTENADSYARLSVDVENEDGTGFSNDYLSIAPGESELVYVYAKLSGLDTEKPIIRINIAGTCYYATVE